MSFTRTINYTQNIPVSLGFSNYLTAPGTDVLTVEFDWLDLGSDSKMGITVFPETAGVTQVARSQSSDTTIFGVSKIVGQTTALNTCLNGAMFQNHFYEADNVVQNFLSQDRTLPSDFRGEVQIQIPADTVHGLSIGSVCRITNSGRYVVTKIDAVNSGIRIWCAFRGDYEINDLYYSSPYKSVAICKDSAGNTITASGTVTKSYTSAYLQTEGSVNIAPICDISYCNPHGDFSIIVRIYDAVGTQIDSGTLNFVGSFFIAEPTFLTTAGTISAPTPEQVYSLSMGTIDQVDDNYQSVQILFKYCENDPAYLNVAAYTQLSGYPSSGSTAQQLFFIGQQIENKAKLNIPTYVTGTAVGTCGINQVGDRISTAPDDGIFRWYFYGTPDECNSALDKIYYYRPAGVAKDFNAEVRIVNGRTRIYNSRGK